jgi:hypothetical protein
VSVDGRHTTTMSLDAVRHWPLLLEALRDRVGGKRIVSVGQVAISFPIVRFFVGIVSSELSTSNYYSDSRLLNIYPFF